MSFNKSSLRWIGLFLFLPLITFSQNIERCHHDQKMEALMQADPVYKKSINTDDWIDPSPQKSLPPVVTIPVHVIITHPPGQAVGTGVNFSMTHIQSQLDVLNEDFRRLNADAGNTPSVFPAADSEIEFCLASFDPSGNPTDGVTRYATNQNLSDDETAIKSATGWNRNTYLNFWVGDGLGGILGWAYLPSTNNLPNATLDGIVVASCTFGGPGFGSCSPYDLGRTATHEVGHYLGLRHVWGNGGCNSDDNIADTPVQSSSNFGCPNHPSPSCSNGGDMFMNYMDYVNDDCMNAFTVGQNARMHVILNNSRSSLLGAAAIACNGQQGSGLTLTLANQTNVSCNGGNDGSLTVIAAGGSGSYTYTINGGTSQSSNTFTDLITATYTVEVDDGSGTASINVTITEPPVLFPLVNSQTNVDCFGNGNGIVVASAIGGTNTTGNGYMYDMNGSGYTSNNVFTNLSGGTYTLSVQDENLCVSSIPVIIVEPDPIISFIDQEFPIDCAGSNSGQVIIGTTGGAGNYFYSLNGGSFSPNSIFPNLSAGNYIVETQDINGCTHQFSFNLTEPSPMQISLVQQVDLDCFGDNDGLIEVSAQGGTTGYQYSIDQGNYQTSPIFNSLSGGNYFIQAQDANGCIEFLFADIFEPTELIATISNQTNVGCAGGNTGSVTIDVSGGTGTPSVTLNGNIATGNSLTFENLPAGTFPFLVSDDNNCETFGSVTISGNSEIILNVVNAQNVNCNGLNNGQIEVLATGGSGNFTYTLNGTPQGNNNIFTNLSSGTYFVESIDDSGCSELISVDIVEPPAITANIAQQTNLNCFGESNGSVSVSATGGLGNIQYTLGNETNGTGTFNNLSAGFYTVSISDINNCMSSINIEITQPTEIFVLETNNISVDCFGNNSGSLEISATGGASNYQFSLGTTTNTSGVFNNLPAGNYSISVTDINNCQTVIQSTITEPTEIIANISNQININCFGENTGSVTLNANGGNGNITFTLNGNTNSMGEFSNLSGGTYNVVVEDQNSCQTNIGITITEPNELNLVIENVTNASCSGQEGNVQLSANGGTGNYQFTLGNTTNSTGLFEGLSGGNYSVQVVDNNMCTEIVSVEITEPTTINPSVSQIQNINCFGGNEGNVQVAATGGLGNLTFTLGNETNTTGFFQNLTAGNYNVVIEDENNCTSTLPIEITQPTELIANISNQVNLNCFGENTGSVTLNANGGNGNTTFTLNGNTNSTGEFSNLPGGIYTIVVEDQNNCQTNVGITITEPNELNLVIENVTNASCSGQEGNVQLSANGGTGNYQFTLGNTTNSTGLFEGLSGGNYSVQVSDNNMCTEMTSIEITEPTNLNLSISQIQNINCFGGNEGNVQVAATGGFGNLTYTLGNETNTTGIFENLIAGSYNIIVEDENNCTTTLPVEITQPTELIANIVNQENINCFGENTGSIILESNGGNGNTTFTINGNTNSTGEFSNLPSGNYSIIIADQNNCEVIIETTINEPTELNLVIESVTEASCTGQEGSVQLSANGGTGNYQFTLGNTTNATGFFEGLGGGNYPIEVSDNNGCLTSQSVEILEPSSLNTSISNIQNINCFGESTGSAQVNGNGGSGVLTFTLGNETNTTGSFENLSAGNYDVIIEDENNCSLTVTIEITQPNELVLTTDQVMQVNCYNGNDGQVNLSTTGGTGTVEFTLNGQTNTNGIFDNLPVGNHDFMATDANGCIDQMQITITAPTEMIAQVDQTQNISCAGSADGSVQLSASGGVGSFTYSLGGQTNSTGLFEGISAGNYPVEVVDANNCLVELIVEIIAPDPIIFELIQYQNVSCNGDTDGFILIQGNGGTGNLTYNLGNATNATGQFENLPAGIYEVVAIDENNCSLTTTSIEIIEPNPIEAIVENVVDNSCYGLETGVIDLTSNGGVGIVQFTLGNETNTTGLFENLPFGFYQVQLEDENNCTTTFEVTISQPEPVVPLSEIISNINCFGDSTGVIQISAGGGDGNFVFSNDNNTNTTGLFENLSEGNYEFHISDGNGCEEFIYVTLEEPEEIQIEIINSTPTGCNGNATGTLQVSATAGTGIITYEMNGVSNTNGFFENLESGVFDLIVIDENGCSSMLDVPISEENDIQLESSNLVNVSCFGNDNGAIFINATSSSGDLTYELNGVTNNTGDFEDLFAGEYNVTIIDINGCSMIIPFEVTEPTEIEFVANSIEDVDCFGTSTGVANLMATGGSNIFTYSMNGEENNTGVFENLPAGTFNAQVLDSYGCLTLLEVVISEPTELVTSATAIENDFGNEEGSATLIGEGGTEPFMYSLDGVNFQSESIFENLAAGEYIGFIQDANGCISQTSFTIEMETGITNPNLGISSMEILPNPFTEFLYLNIELEFSQKIQLEMFTVLGQEVYRKTIDLQTGFHQVDLEPNQELPAGSYILRVRNDEKTVGYFKLVKQK